MVDKLGSSTLPRALTSTDQSDKTAGPAGRTEVTNPVEKNRIERAERDYALATLSPGEAAMGAATKALRPHQSVEFSCKLGVDAGVALKGEGKIKIEKRDDGMYEVSVSANAAIGLGGGMAGVAAGTRFVVATPEAAADVAQAVATIGVTTAAYGTGLAPVVSFADTVSGASAHALERLKHYSRNCSALEVDARILKGVGHIGGTKHDLGKVELEGLGARSVRVNIETGEVVTGRRLEITGEALASMKLGSGAAGSIGGQLGLSGDAEVKVSLAFEERRKIPPDLLERLKRGEVSASEVAIAAHQGPVTYALVGKVEGEFAIGTAAAGVGRFEAKRELSLDSNALFDQLAKRDIAGLLSKVVDGAWDAECELGRGSRPQLNVASEDTTTNYSVGARMSALVLTKHHLGSGTLNEVADRAKRTANDSEQSLAFVNAQRARAALPT
jgi:hypothetical protein